ncbi:uncharacterized protein LOC116351078 [Contarinia nasturtii]|uniref:uncharacterized protein LOC116351078 n=1 Tax=Contarinia nasturtii TaxID=265458 RepID=UPI0012D441D6|nr:uncharacterized protein LOC116351078 [Contarinia nasturtii]
MTFFLSVASVLLISRVFNKKRFVFNRIIQAFLNLLNMAGSNPDVIPVNEAKRFVADCFRSLNVPQKHADLMANLLIAADCRGHFSHGMHRLEIYLHDIQTSKTDGAAVPTILKESPCTAWVNGNNGLGAVVGRFCMDLAIKKAKEVGIGWVCANHSNHYGIAGWYSIQAQEQGLIGISMTNGGVILCPTRGKEAALGTNPISVAAPANNGDGFVLDMATSAVAFGKVELQRRKQLPITSGWALDKDGDVTTDAKKAFEAGMLLPLGGLEETSGYKGYGLCGMVEVMTGILSNANFATKGRKWSLDDSSSSEANIGHVFIAINPNCFAPGFTDRMTEMNGILRNVQPVNEEKPVLVPGDLERAYMKKTDEEGGIRYHVNQLKNCDQIAAKHNVSKIGSM